MRRTRLTWAVLVVGVLAAASAAHAGHSGRVLRIGVYSQNVSPRQAAIGAHIRVRDEKKGRTGGAARESHGVPQLVASSTSRPTPGAVREPLPNPYPSLPSNSPVLGNPTPVGPGSFWYTDGRGHTCMYAPSSVLPCFTVVAPSGAAVPGAPAVSPAAVAAAVADRLPLTAGQIHDSPSARGLTGAASWFWLDPAPQATVLSMALAGERVMVSAEPAAVEWRFGDGGSLSGEAGVPYRPGAPPPDAVTHVYETRCLPGDQGRNPYVLSSCGTGGYTVEAVVSWRISFQASGPVGTAGSLPTRTSEASVVYPVSEARAFLVGGGSQ